MRCNIPQYLSSLAADLPNRHERVVLPLVAFDQNLNARKLRCAISRLISAGRIESSMPLWYEERLSRGGERSYSLGSLSRRAAKLLSLGRWSGRSSDDELVICNLIAQFGIYDRIAFLTADHGNDAKGIMALLHGAVRPSLQESHSNRLGLVVLGQSGSTNLDSFITSIEARLSTSAIQPGYEEVWM